MAVGFPTKVDYATGDVLSATNMNDLSGTVNLLESAQYAAGKNKIINGDFGVWQRGTSLAARGFLADRFVLQGDGSGATVTQSRQTFTPGTAPVAGYEGQYFYRLAQTVAGTGATFQVFDTRVENVQTLAGQIVTLSFWAKADATRQVNTQLNQNFGSGGSSTVSNASPNFNLTTSWVRYTQTFTLASLTGKTIGSGSFLEVRILLPINTAMTIDFWGVQLEAASSASPFQTATGTIQGELAACQRYNENTLGGTTSVTNMVGAPVMATNTGGNIYRALYIPYKVTKRAVPTVTIYDNLAASGKIMTVSSADLSTTSGITGTADNIGIDNYRVYWLTTNGGAAWNHVVSAEL